MLMASCLFLWSSGFSRAAGFCWWIRFQIYFQWVSPRQQLFAELNELSVSLLCPRVVAGLRLPSNTEKDLEGLCLHQPPFARFNQKTHTCCSLHFLMLRAAFRVKICLKSHLQFDVSATPPAGRVSEVNHSSVGGDLQAVQEGEGNAVSTWGTRNLFH